MEALLSRTPPPIELISNELISVVPRQLICPSSPSGENPRAGLYTGDRLGLLLFQDMNMSMKPSLVTGCN